MTQLYSITCTSTGWGSVLHINYTISWFIMLHFFIGFIGCVFPVHSVWPLVQLTYWELLIRSRWVCTMHKCSFTRISVHVFLVWANQYFHKNYGPASQTNNTRKNGPTSKKVVWFETLYYITTQLQNHVKFSYMYMYVFHDLMNLHCASIRNFDVYILMPVSPLLHFYVIVCTLVPDFL